ncbi:hypothetical protein ABEB36_014043 [Hypothenemus hampei]|uniref:G-protein coupled receptors family 1 profile domain-containing protein n=1 Tax=Hypothenemus hampei TaxID=57062 RepID=A0ABD1E340_HYPHA
MDHALSIGISLYLSSLEILVAELQKSCKGITILSIDDQLFLEMDKLIPNNIPTFKGTLNLHQISRLELDLQNIHFLSIIIDSSNHKEIKIVLILVRYFSCEKGIQVKLFRASIERLFSNINIYWSPEKSPLKISTLETAMQVYTNFNESCSEMFTYLKAKSTILKSILSSENLFVRIENFIQDVNLKTSNGEYLLNEQCYQEDFKNTLMNDSISCGSNPTTKTQLQMRHSGNSFHASTRGSPACSENVLKARKGVIRMLIIVVVAFALCNLPFHARKMWQYWSSNYHGNSNFSAVFTPLTMLCTYFNSGVNPLLYAFLSKNFRRGMREILFCSPSKKKRNSLCHYRMSTRSPDGGFLKQNSTRSTLKSNHVTTVTVMQECSSDEV